jgi:hypothetical protein
MTLTTYNDKTWPRFKSSGFMKKLRKIESKLHSLRNSMSSSSGNSSIMSEPPALQDTLAQPAKPEIEDPEKRFIFSAGLAALSQESHNKMQSVVDLKALEDGQRPSTAEPRYRSKYRNVRRTMSFDNVSQTSQSR